MVDHQLAAFWPVHASDLVPSLSSIVRREVLYLNKVFVLGIREFLPRPGNSTLDGWLRLNEAIVVDDANLQRLFKGRF